MSDWQVGDLAVCIDATVSRATRSLLREGAIYTVTGISLDRGFCDTSPCGLLFAELPIPRPQIAYASDRFRKVVKDKQEACEEEFTTLLKRNRVNAIATEARRAETSSGSVHEGAGPQDIAQTSQVRDHD